MSRIKSAVRSVKGEVKRRLRSTGFEVTRTVDTRFLRSGESVDELPVCPERLAELRSRYERGPRELTTRSVWGDDKVANHTYVDEGQFRSESMYVYQFVNRAASSRVREAEYRYAIYLEYLRSRDTHGLLDRLSEDGAFGAPVFDFPGQNPVSRDLLDSVNEILYLDRRLGMLDRSSMRVLDIGAGYGRLAHRMAEVVDGLTDYACVDAIPESTYTCERYLAFRGVSPPCRVVELPDIEAEAVPGKFDLAVNIHSFSEMPRSAIQFWIDLVARAEIPWLLVIPNEPRVIRSFEPDGTRHEMTEYLERSGYVLEDMTPIVEDDAGRELYEVKDHFHFYARR